MGALDGLATRGDASAVTDDPARSAMYDAADNRTQLVDASGSRGRDGTTTYTLSGNALSSQAMPGSRTVQYSYQLGSGGARASVGSRTCACLSWTASPQATTSELRQWRSSGSSVGCYALRVETGTFDEEAFFRALATVRCLLIGRRALVALSLPVLTADYDLWLHIDDIESLNASLEPLALRPNRAPAEARAAGRYVLENDEHVDVLVARSCSTVDGVAVHFDDLWRRRQSVVYAGDLVIALPTIDDLILTKRFGARRKDVLDIELLEALKASKG